MRGEICRRGSKIVRHLADDPSSRPARARWEVHLAECPACREHARALLRLVREAARIAPPPLTEPAARRIEDSVLASIRSGTDRPWPAVAPPAHRPLPALALAASVALLAGTAVVLWLLLSSRPPGPPAHPPTGPVAASPAPDGEAPGVAALLATVEAARGAHGTLPVTADLAPGATLPPGTEVTTDAAGELVLRFADGSLAALRGPGQIAVLPDRRGLDLRAGLVAVRAARSEPGRGFVVRVADWQAEVVGTRFVVAAGDDGGSVSVLEGTVAVTLRSTGRTWNVPAGRFLAPRSGAETRALSPEERDRFSSLVPRDPARSTAPDNPPAASAAAAPPPAPPRPSATRNADASLSSSTSQRSVAVPRAIPGAPSPVQRALQAMAAGDPAAAVAALEPDASQGRLDREGLALLAEAYAACGRVEDAVRVYRLLAVRNPGSPAAENASYAAARLLLDRGGSPREALDWIDALQRDFPNGALAEETAIARFEALLRLRDARARSALEDYLARFPAGYRAAEASYLLGVELQAEGACDRALPLLNRYLELRPSGAKAADARQRIAACGGDATGSRREP